MTFTFDFQGQIDKSCIWGIVIWLMWNKRKANQLDTDRADCMVLPFDHTHDFDLVV